MSPCIFTGVDTAKIHVDRGATPVKNLTGEPTFLTGAMKNIHWGNDNTDQDQTSFLTGAIKKYLLANDNIDQDWHIETSKC